MSEIGLKLDISQSLQIAPIHRDAYPAAIFFPPGSNPGARIRRSTRSTRADVRWFQKTRRTNCLEHRFFLLSCRATAAKTPRLRTNHLRLSYSASTIESALRLSLVATVIILTLAIAIVKMKTENIVRKIRKAAGMTQEELGRFVGKGTARVRQYEDGADPPPDVIERLKSLAVKHDKSDLALALTSDEWKVRHVIEPGETLISQRPPSYPRAYNPRNQAWHDMLESILESGDEKAIKAVEPNLVIFYAWITEKSPQKSLAKVEKGKP